ncbi:MAG: MMPL family transporter [Myxococcota bacterium]
MRLRAFVVIGALALVGLWAGARLRVDTDITQFLPATEDRLLAELSQALTSSDLNRTITLTVEASDGDAAAAAARALAERLVERPEIAWVRSGPDETLERAFYEVYFPRRLNFLEPLNEDSIRQRIARLKRELASPTGAFVRRIAPEDPWLAFVEHVEALQAQQGELRIREGSFVTGEEDRFGVVLLATEASPFDTTASRSLQRAIAEDFAAINDGTLTLEQAGVHRIAVRSEETIRADIQRVSIVGTLGVVLLILVLFQTPRHLVLAGLPLAGGMVVAIAVVSTIFDAIHGLTLAFGATLIGVAMDYVAHLLNHDHLARHAGDDAHGTARRIWPGLALGAATTIAGLSGLAWTSFPGIRQMAIFTSVGIATAVLITRYVLPPLMPAAPRTTGVHRRIAAVSSRVLDGLARHRRALWLLPCAGAILAAAGLPLLTWQDDIRALNPTDPELRAEDGRVRQRVARMEAARFVIATGATREEALTRNDEVFEKLEAAVDAEELSSFRSLHPLLLSEATQRRNYESIPNDAWAQTTAALEAEGFVTAPFAPFEDVLRAPFSPLTNEAFDGTPLAQLAAAHQLPFGDGHAVLSFLHGVHDIEALRARTEAIEGVRVFDQAAFMQEAYGTFRSRTLELIVAGLFAVFLLVLVRYRRLRLSLAAFLPALIAAFATLGLLGLLGIDATLLHVVALLLVLSMGVDYGVFMVETEMHEGDDGPATLVSLITACLSTAASFGVLALSANPALRAMGLTAAIGVTMSLVLAPAAWILARRTD